MDPSYSLRIPVKEVPNKKKTRKRKIISHYQQAQQTLLTSYEYQCYQCAAKVYFLPGHELVCATCASRIVEKINLHPQKREIRAR